MALVRRNSLPGTPLRPHEHASMFRFTTVRDHDSSSEKGSHANQKCQGYVHRITGTREHGESDRYCIKADGRCCLASIAEKRAVAAPRRDEGAEQAPAIESCRITARNCALTPIQAMEALLNETEKMLSLLEDDNLRDAGLIASAQKLEHYEIAAYGTAEALASQLELRDDQRMLHDSLEEERKTNAALTKLAKGEVNQDAAPA